MAEAAGENKLEAEIDLGTAKAFQNVTQLVEALIDAQEKIVATGTALDNTERKLASTAAATEKLTKETKETTTAHDAAGEAAKKAGAKATEAAKETEASEKKSTDATKDKTKAEHAAGDAAEQTGEKRKKVRIIEADAIGGTQKDLLSVGGVQEKIISGIGGMISGWLGIQAVFKVLEVLETRFNAISDAQTKVVDTANRELSKSQNLVLNLGLTGPNAQERALALTKKFIEQAPGATQEQIQGVVGAAASTGLTPENQKDFDLMLQIIKTAAPLQLSRQTTADLVKQMQATGNLSPSKPEATQKFLSQIVAAQRLTPVEDPQEFMSSFIRATVPLTTKGVDISDAAGLFSAAAAADPSAMRAATTVERFSRLWSGSGDLTGKSQANIFKRAREAGLLDPKTTKEFDASAAKAIEGFTERQKVTYSEYEKTLKDLEADALIENTQFKRAMDNAERDKAKLKTAGKDTKDIDDRIKTLQENHVKAIRESGDRERQTTSQMGLMMGEQREKDMGAAWMALPEKERMSVFLKLLRSAKSDQARSAIMTGAGASMEESLAGTKVFAPGAISQGEQTRAGVAAAAPSLSRDAAEQYAAEPTSAAAQSAELRTINEAQSATPGLFISDRMFKDAETKITTEKANLAKTGEMGFAVEWDSFFGNGKVNVWTTTDDQYALAQQTKEIFRQTREWWDSLPAATRTAMDAAGEGFEAFKAQEKLIIEKQLTLLNWSPITRKRLRDFSVQIGNLMTNVRQGKYGGMKGPAAKSGGAATQGGKAVSLFGGGAGGGASGGGGAGGELPENVSAPGGVGSAIGGSAVAAAGGAINYNVSIGMVVSNGGESLDLPSPLNA